MSKPVILTGLRANSDLHLGNYLGAMLPMIDMANGKSEQYQINMFIPDLHSFTTPIDHSKLLDQIMQNARLYSATGLSMSDDSIYVYRQSYIPAHSELTVILNSFTSFGEMRRMTQFKDKAEQLKVDPIFGKEEYHYKKYGKHSNFTSVGLFDYPVLMAADILLYGASYIPVGDDQTQHLEFTRDIAERMNAKFGELFVVPKPVKEQHAFFAKDQGLRVRDLLDPTKKMSKSDETGKGVIFLSDDPEVARKKIMSAATDSLANIQYDYEKQPGISNLLDIYEQLGGDKNEFIGHDQYGPFKAAVAEKVASFLADFQVRLSQVDDSALLKKLASSEAAMNEQANNTLHKVQKAVGLR